MWGPTAAATSQGSTDTVRTASPFGTGAAAGSGMVTTALATSSSLNRATGAPTNSGPLTSTRAGPTRRRFAFPSVRQSLLDYDRARHIGSGSTCYVHVCNYGGIEAAFKRYHPHLLADVHAVSRGMARELRVVAFLQHPNIVRVLSVVLDDTEPSANTSLAVGAVPATEASSDDTVPRGNEQQDAAASFPACGLVMEKMASSLQDRLPRPGDAPPAVAATAASDAASGASGASKRMSSGMLTDVPHLLKVARDIACGIGFAHANNVVHSDIKPANVMLDADGTAKLCDFGTAYVLSTLATKTTSGPARGTPMFTAPEYADGGSEEVSKACDVFSFGVLLWSMFHPTTAHGLGKTTTQVAIAYLRGKRPPLSTDPAMLPPTVRDLIAQCWHSDPDARPTMAAALQSIVAAQGALATAVPTVPPPNELFGFLGHPRHIELRRELRRLTWAPKDTGTWWQAAEPLTDPRSPLFQHVASAMGPTSLRPTRITMIQHGLVDVFVRFHEGEAHSRAMNPRLREAPHPDCPRTQAGLAALERRYIDADSPNLSQDARLVYGWHGTHVSNVDDVCRDGPRSLRTTDAGFFGSGSYLGLEADYAARYSTPSEGESEAALVLFAASVGQVYVVTTSHDYYPLEHETDPHHPHRRPPHSVGFSRFYSSQRETAVALHPGCNAHYVPVKRYGGSHPVSNLPLPPVYDAHTQQLQAHDVDYQACDEGPEATGHELVLLDVRQLTPVAVVYFDHPNFTRPTPTQ